MKITFIKLFKKEKPVLMKHLRKEEKIFNVSKMFRNKEEENIKKEISKKLNNKYINIFLDNLHRVSKKNILKKNQLSLIAISLMLVTAGYLNYSNNLKHQLALNDDDIGEAVFVSTNTVKEDDTINEIFESLKITENDYYTETKLDRDKMYSQMIESYQKIINSDNSTIDQKNEASKQIRVLNERKESIATIEKLLITKGFDTSVILINDNSVNVIVKKDKLNDDEVAQIQNIVTRELKCDAEDIHISTKI